MPELFHYLYTSTIAADVSPQCIGSIVWNARVNNAARDVTSLLAFDGWRLCQYLEGRSSDVLALVDIIRDDPRHHSIVPVHQGPRDGPRRFPNEPMSYGMLYDDRPLAVLETLRDTAALDAFDRIVPELDTGAL